MHTLPRNVNNNNIIYSTNLRFLDSLDLIVVITEKKLFSHCVYVL